MTRFILLIIAALAFTGVAQSAEPAKQPAVAVEPTKPADLPVILLTGYEPFGPGKPANPSWEGIKKLDGQERNGYRLVARELPVVWGAPLPALKKLIEEFRPAAIFSFGQGGGYTIETLAQNKRGAFPDNAGELPEQPMIVPDGPAEYQTTIDAKGLAERLKSRGQTVRISTEAGNYLCEEALYTLEHLKANAKQPLAVAFCHVPPLQANDGQGPTTPETVQAFVESLLDAWAEQPRPAAVSEAAPTVARQQAADPREKEVRELIDRYFTSWSNADLLTYGKCFMPQAAIHMIEPSGRLLTLPLAPFLKSQQEAHRSSPNKMTETPERTEIRFDANLAHALVYWKLVDGERIEYGYDHFTLMKSDGEWRIVNIVFYVVKPPADGASK
jgi:pyroglutamyl-peptidase